VDESSVKCRCTVLLFGIPALDSYLPEERHVFYLLSLGGRGTVGKWCPIPKRTKSDYRISTLRREDVLPYERDDILYCKFFITVYAVTGPPRPMV
jgi:hypothetical protein